MTDPILRLEAEITAAGHELERTFEGAVANAPAADDLGWVVRVDNHVVATGGSLGRVEAGLRGWWKGEANV